MNLNASLVHDAERLRERWSSGNLSNEETPLPLEKNENSGLPTEKEGKSLSLGYLGSQQCDERNHCSSELVDQSRSTVRQKYTSVPMATCTRNLRSRSQDNPPVPEPAVVTDDAVKKRERRKKRQIKKDSTNEFSRMRNHLKYLLNRMMYEQNLIDAYSAEGWKGQSLEKIKPEKELQRAKSHILRYKLRVRDLLQRLDLSLAEGRFPESLFDDKGLIDSEDIFCAKCGSKDLPDGNDIILCDGVCERGFHQFCLEPPLLKEDIPPGDELWLCPGCKCKVDCMHLVNDWHGAKLSFLDSWEKVFPEAAAAASGKTLEGSSGFSEDDSEDDDYDPDKPEVKEEVQGDGISSNKCDKFSASDDLATSPNSKPSMGVPSEDSEDDEYDPGAADHDVDVKEESLSSDFASDSEYLGDEFCDNPSLVEDQGKTNSDGVKLDTGRSNAVPALGKRHVQRLDYDKLNNEMYGNVATDSSDEDYEKTAGRKRRRNISQKISPTSPENPPVLENGGDVQPENHKQNHSEHAPERTNKKLDVEGTNNSLTSLGDSLEARSSVKSTGRRYKILQEETTQRLLQSFKENKYPKRPEKEKLAKELGITFQQVDRWFNNTRWISRHPARMESDVTAGASTEHT